MGEWGWGGVGCVSGLNCIHRHLMGALLLFFLIQWACVGLCFCPCFVYANNMFVSTIDSV